MGRLCLLLLVPVCLANVLPVYVGSWLPRLLPQPLPGGNRRHEVVLAKTRNNNNKCGDLTAEWHTWETGLSGTIRVKRDPVKKPGQPQEMQRSLQEDDGWEVEMVFDKPVNKLDVYNGIVDKDAGQDFKVVSPKWSTKTADGGDSFSLKAEFPATSFPPQLEGLVVDGVYKTCRELKPTTNGARVATSQHVPWPSKVLGLYVLLADDDEKGDWGSESDSWQPELFPWQQEAANVLFFTFIHPETMDIPPSFQKLASTRGTGAPGAVPADTVIMFAIGGYAYSLKPNPWHWLTSKAAAEKMAYKVAEWPDKYGCDGIDLDLEEGAGAKREAGPNMIHFIRKLKELQPNMIVSQPTYGYPQVRAEIDVINASWDTEGNHQGLADSIGLMVYEGTNALNYVKNYASGSTQWGGYGFPIEINAPKNAILLGAKGSSSSGVIGKLADASIRDDLLGIMVWYASVKNGFDYAPNWDASTKQDSINGYKSAMKRFKAHMG